ncbi:MAG: DM13 domain-containing protein [Flavobacterium sp.]|uniref:DM13 domain-containing protein n=1 Tax=Flavobacterium sp. TaxID=239 RepID=UPI0022BE3C2A|nr:DM13 domain-containing protein [Flavobacterium sp.]MCZ8196766.1 DM13 domain-containing protein [Flavobacterium sp.]
MITFKKAIFKLVSLTLLVVLLSSCSSDVDNANATITPTPTASLYKGSFVSAVHPTSGIAAINTDKTMLTFTSFMSDNGPNLDIYLVSDLSNVNAAFINLGDIKGLNGSYSYDLPANIDITVYKHVVVWCSDFNVNFGYATLVKQ